MWRQLTPPTGVPWRRGWVIPSSSPLSHFTEAQPLGMHGYGHFPYSIQRSISSDLFPYSRHDILILFSYQWIAAHFDAVCLFVMNHVMMIVVLLEIPFLEKKNIFI
jgi:hypothetical protein